MQDSLVCSLPRFPTPVSAETGETAIHQGIPNADEFTARANRARALLKKLSKQGKGFYFNPDVQGTSFEKSRGSFDANRVILMAETIFKYSVGKEKAALLLEQIAHPLELLEKVGEI